MSIGDAINRYFKRKQLMKIADIKRKEAKKTRNLVVWEDDDNYGFQEYCFDKSDRLMA